MRILHLCLSCFYIDDYNYQENVLPRQNLADGHEVKIIASTVTYVDNQLLGFTEPLSYINCDGIPVERVAYRKILPRFVMNKLRLYPGIYDRIEAFAPDVIFFHGPQSFELFTAVKYKTKHPGVRLYVDSHADYYTSATNWLSRRILHDVLYKWLQKKCMGSVDCYFPVSVTCRDFLENEYGIPSEKIELFHLGGTILPEEERNSIRASIRSALKLSDDEIMIVQAGKLDSAKVPVETLRAFIGCKDPKLRFFLIGSLGSDVKEEVLELLEQEPRAEYLGWKNGNELQNYLCACDIYVQPGKVSAIAQNALCCGAAVILKDWPDYEPFVNGNGWLVGECRDITDILDGLDALRLPAMRRASLDIAECYLDYSRLAARFTGS